MEAATPLPFAQVSVRNGRLAIDALVVEDETAVRLAQEAADPARLVIDAIAKGRYRGQGQMPDKLFEGEDARAVAAYVAKVAGR